MERSFIRKFGLLILSALAGVLAFILLYDHVSPNASLDMRFTRGEIMDHARIFLTDLGYDLKDYQQDAWLIFDGNNHLHLQIQRGVKEANEMIRADSLPTHRWYVSWYDKTLTRDQMPETFEVWMSPSAKVLGFNHNIKDSTSKLSLETKEAEELARAFLSQQGMDLSEYDLKKSSSTKQPNREDHRFEWSRQDTIFETTLWIRVQGEEVGGFRMSVTPVGEFTQVFSQTGTTATFLITASFAAVFLLFFFIVTLFLKKYHEGEVGTKTALLVFIGLLTVSVLAVVNQYPVTGADAGVGDLNKFNVRIVVFVFNVFIVQVFLSVMAFAGWSVGESSSRSTWSEKIAAVDSALFRRFFTLDVGEGILRGYAWGVILLGAYTALLYGMMQYFDVGVYERNLRGLPEAYFPGLQPILEAMGIALFSEIIFRLFFISYLKEKTRKTWIGVLVSTVIWSVAAFSMWGLPYGYLMFDQTFVVLFLFGLFFSYLFLKYDLLTAITANFVVSALSIAIPLLSSTSPRLELATWVFTGLLGAPLLVAGVGLIRRERFEFTLQTLPAHIQRITERERMAKELEIARRVQMSLLPKVNPMADGYDIAGVCIPALEVGGDYYDFVNLGGKSIGIAIGDVSGKGVPAAIYMTLTKGILQSHAEENISPRIVLSKVNNLMYRTIDRNSFVSMFYAILDLEKKRIRFARAGQCPAIVAQRFGEKGTLLTPKGMALGLEKGKVFDTVLEEEELELQSGEVLVFYTDGFTEGMNSSDEEFGEQRLVEAIARHRDKSAKGIIESICREVQEFIADRPQHDDMTMVVVKVG